MIKIQAVLTTVMTTVLTAVSVVGKGREITMKFFLDSAKMDEIRYAYDTFGIDGVTTNPGLY